MLQLSKAEYHLARELSIDSYDDDFNTARDLFIGLSQKYMALEPCSQARKRNYFVFAKDLPWLTICNYVN